MSNSMRVFTDEGVEVLDVPDYSERSVVGQHWNAVRSSLEGDLRALGPFEGETVAGRHLQTDPDEIETWGHQGDIDWEHIYAS